jgi:aryl-alcohol dehydrogenase-like predicted oxidoreductase
MIEQYPEEVQVVLFPFTGGSRQACQSSLLDVVRAHGAGALAIKPFGSGALFGSGGDNDRLGRLAIRHILGHPAITAAVAGFASTAQLENAAAAAAANRHPLDPGERAELEQATAAMWPRLSWLKDWQQV